MSDVPELDKLLKDHERYLRNVAWDKRERRFRIFFRLLIAGSVAFLFCLAIGLLGILIFPSVYYLVKKMTPAPPWRDPFGYYNYM